MFVDIYHLVQEITRLNAMLCLLETGFEFKDMILARLVYFGIFDEFSSVIAISTRFDISTIIGTYPCIVLLTVYRLSHY